MPLLFKRHFLEKQKAHECDVCGKRYLRKEGLNVHKKLYCGQEPKYECKVCSHKFYQAGHMRNHMLTVHKILIRRS